MNTTEHSRSSSRPVPIAIGHREESTFPRAALVLPPLVPVAVLAAVLLSGSRGSGIHSTGGAILLVLLWLSTLVVVVLELVLVPKAFKRFLLAEKLQTVPNLLCLLAASAFVALVTIGLFVSVLAT